MKKKKTHMSESTSIELYTGVFCGLSPSDPHSVRALRMNNVGIDDIICM